MDRNVGTRIIKGYWDCTYCGTKHIDGLIDVCPNCAKRKPDNVKYYIGTTNPIKMEEVTDSELRKAGISRKECDGKHKEWVCGYCGQINNYADQECKACGASKMDKSGEYGSSDTPKKDKQKDIVEQRDKSISYAKEQKESVSDSYNYSNKGNDRKEPKINRIFNKVKDFVTAHCETLIAMFAIVLVALLCGILFFPYQDTETVTGFSWKRTISVEELKTFHESGWSLPSGARQTDTKIELYGYQPVLDHYETKYRTVSQQVYDGEEVHTTYSDNGNGTFTEHTYTTPKYRTEYVQESYQDPVYRQEPIYQTKYYYDIDRWTVIDKYTSSGDDQNPYWNEKYTLAEKQRDTSRAETYTVWYINKKGKEFSRDLPYKEWEDIRVGYQYATTKCLLGITYKSESINNTNFSY